jgi:hypothetical protein
MGVWLHVVRNAHAVQAQCHRYEVPLAPGVANMSRSQSRPAERARPVLPCIAI